MLDELTPNARTVLAELGPKAQTADDLAAATGLAVQAVLAALMELEFAGAAVDNGRGPVYRGIRGKRPQPQRADMARIYGDITESIRLR